MKHRAKALLLAVLCGYPIAEPITEHLYAEARGNPIELANVDLVNEHLAQAFSSQDLIRLIEGKRSINNAPCAGMRYVAGNRLARALAGAGRSTQAGSLIRQGSSAS